MRLRPMPAVLLALLWTAASAASPDTTPPAAPAIVVDTPLFGFSGEPSGRFECHADADPWTACVSPWDSGVASDGDHVVEIRQIDDAGNVGAPAGFSWTNSPPEPDEGTGL